MEFNDVMTLEEAAERWKKDVRCPETELPGAG